MSGLEHNEPVSVSPVNGEPEELARKPEAASPSGEADPGPPRRSIWRENAEALIIAVLFATFAKTYVVQAFKIPSASMEENLLVGDHILVNKFVYAPAAGKIERALFPKRRVERGDVVVFKFPLDPTRDFIKRCLGLPGDTVELIDKRLWINGEQIDESGYTDFRDPQTYRIRRGLPEELRSRDSFGPYTVPEGQLFCMGDNRDESDDSRRWGTVPVDYVKGRALMIYWSFEGKAEVESESWSARRTFQRLYRVAKNFFTDTRWHRSFQLVR